MPTSRLLILIALLLSVLGFSLDAKADVCQYQARDYQGNNRVLTDYSGNAIERYDYYPYGGLFGEVNPEQWRLYGGKELQTVNGLNLYDFHARWQDYATCWFTTQDPLAEKYYALSPYTYCAGNPIMLIDPTGMRFEYAEDMTPKQREQLDVIITSLKESDLFMIVYEAIEVSKEVVTLQFGETVKDNHGKNVPGQFEPNTEDNTGGNITFDTNHELSAAVVAEELYHSYQNITPNKEDANTNFEFEAKVFTIGTTTLRAVLPEMEILSNNALNEVYGTESNPYTTDKLDLLKKDYENVGKGFVKYHKETLSNSHYTKPVDFMPRRLINLIEKIR